MMMKKITSRTRGKMINKITPTGGLTWYIKWVSSFILLIGMVLTSLDISPYNLFFHAIGVFGWFIVGMMWNDRAIIFINAIAFSIFLTGVINFYV